MIERSTRSGWAASAPATPAIAIHNTYSTTFGHAGTNLGRATGRDLRFIIHTGRAQYKPEQEHPERLGRQRACHARNSHLQWRESSLLTTYWSESTL